MRTAELAVNYKLAVLVGCAVLENGGILIATSANAVTIL
jgi:hypothetical protein